LAFTLFIADLHLHPKHPEITAALADFLAGEAAQAEALYILGDLFEAWIGDDMGQVTYARELALLKDFATKTPTFFMQGNRDFLLGQAFCERLGLHFLPDPSRVNLYGTDYLLTHADALCTDDVAYQSFRAMVRNPAFQADFLAKSLEERLAILAQIQNQGAADKQAKSAEIMDVNLDAVQALAAQYGCNQLIHGHTHRPAVHHEGTVTRTVLGDWSATGGRYVKVDAQGAVLI
jgi:UDP-2,3-diacylglucosamine hydrolase